MKKSVSGFTIVELLIVIVVIGILATIAVVTFNDVQTRAKNTQTISAAKEGIKLLQLYKAANGVYPSAAYSYACFGEYTSDVCQYVSPGSVEVAEEATFKTAIATVGTMPQPNPSIYVLSGTRTGGGAFYRVTQQDVIYYLAGNNRTCSAGGGGYNEGTVTSCIYGLP